MARCTLCGGKLSGHICTECGLDNSKSDLKYQTHKTVDEKLNSPLTHSHKESDFDPLAGKTTTKKQEKQIKKNFSEVFDKVDTSRRPSQRSAEPGKRKIVSIAVTMIMVIIAIGNIVGVIREGSYYVGSYDEPVYEEGDTYTWYFLQNDLKGAVSDDGNYFATTLTSGCYKVGVHIPEGIYSIQCDGDYANFSVTYTPEDVYDLSGVVWDGDFYEGLNLCTGMRIVIDGNAKLTFETFSSQDNLNTFDNPSADSFSIAGYADGATSYLAGVDITPGVYDLYLDEEQTGSVWIDYSTSGNYNTCYYYIGPSEEGFHHTVYNIVLPEGATIGFDGINDLTLIPSALIESTDYASFYE